MTAIAAIILPKLLGTIKHLSSSKHKTTVLNSSYFIRENEFVKTRLVSGGSSKFS